MFANRTDVELIYSDASGSTAALVAHFPIDTTYAAAASMASALGAVVASISGCVLVRQRIKYVRVVDSSPPAAIGSSVKRRAVLFFGCGTDLPLALVEIVSPLDSIFLTSGPSAGYEVDLTNSDILAFRDVLIANDATNPFGDAIVDIQSGYLQSRV